MSEMTINQRLHEALGICWHEWEFHGSTTPGPGMSYKCVTTGEWIHHQLKEPANQDLLAQVSIPCVGCRGTGGRMHHTLKECKTFPYTEQDPKNPPRWKECPTCNGLKTRRITRLQQIMEERGEWEEFYAYLLVDADGVEIALDANKLGAYVLE